MQTNAFTSMKTKDVPRVVVLASHLKSHNSSWHAQLYYRSKPRIKKCLEEKQIPNDKYPAVYTCPWAIFHWNIYLIDQYVRGCALRELSVFVGCGRVTERLWVLEEYFKYVTSNRSIGNNAEFFLIVSCTYLHIKYMVLLNESNRIL